MKYSYETIEASKSFEITMNILRPVMKALLRIKVIGAENIPDGSFLISTNHISHIDALLVSYHHDMPPVHNMAMSELFRKPVQARFLLSMNCFPVYRGHGEADKAIDYSVKLLKNNRCVGIYPEGAISKKPPYNPKEAKSGVARIAVEAGSDVVPCMLYCKGKPGLFKTFYVSYGKPITAEKISEIYNRNGNYREAAKYIFDKTALMWEMAENDRLV